jgi:Flp pilus assembly protein TadG
MRIPKILRKVVALSDEAGQALVEFAFVLMMMIVLILGLVDFARVFLQYQVLTDVAREGARRAVVADATWVPDSIYGGILNSLQVGGINTTGAARTNSCAAPDASVSVVTVYECRWDSTTTGDSVRVGIAVPFEFAMVGPFIGWATGDRTITLRTSFFMRNE